MKKYLIAALIALLIALVFPYIWNSCIVTIPTSTAEIISIRDWNSTVPPIMSALMSLLVIVQAEKQRETSEKVQERMERINAKMLDVSRKEKLGYFVPEVKEEINEGKFAWKTHPLRNYIYLRNSGNDSVFVSVKKLSVCGENKKIPDKETLWFSCEGPFSIMDFECYLSDEELHLPELKISITLQLTNMTGYQYFQELEIGFVNKNGCGVANSFNMRLLEVSENAD